MNSRIIWTDKRLHVRDMLYNRENRDFKLLLNVFTSPRAMKSTASNGELTFSLTDIICCILPNFQVFSYI